jgi:molecular chaperone DnaK
MRLSRAKFDQMTEDLVKRSLIPCQKCLDDSGFSLSEIDEVILVGGSTRIPSIQKAVRDFFGKEPNKSVNPDEVVAIGAAIQGGVLSGSVKQILLLDVTPLSLGIETLGGVMTKLVERNTTLPVKRSQTFSTAADNQTSVDIHVVQGEREMAAHNKTLGRFELVGIRAAPRGLPQIEVTFDIDANGILNVSAKDVETGKEQAIKITAKSGLTEDEINRMVKEAEEHAEEDRNRRERAQVANDLDTTIYNLEKLFRDKAADIAKSDVSTGEELIARGRTLLANLESTPTELREVFDKLQALNNKISTSLYEKKSAGGAAGAPGGDAGAGGGASDAKGGDDVIDADYKDVR